MPGLIESHKFSPALKESFISWMLINLWLETELCCGEPVPTSLMKLDVMPAKICGPQSKYIHRFKCRGEYFFFSVKSFKDKSNYKLNYSVFIFFFFFALPQKNQTAIILLLTLIEITCFSAFKIKICFNN